LSNYLIPYRQRPRQVEPAALNGRAQPHFKILGRAHAGTTEIQEGLAVFAEIISGAMDPDRFTRLSDRVIAIQMSIEGADFKEVFDFYNARIEDPDQAYENTSCKVRPC